MLKIVTVVNKFDIFNKVIDENKAINNYPIIVYDNSTENIGISERYNHFIDKNIGENSDFWVIFCHQDFGFNKDPLKILNKLDKNFIYGPIGATRTWYSWNLNINLFSRKPISISLKQSNALLGQINQGNKGSFFKTGLFLLNPAKVETVDCCCLIIHSSLINKHSLKFDNNTKFHLYSEEFSINAKLNYGIKTKAVQLDCFHLSPGCFNGDYHTTLDYVKKKHNLKKIIST